MIKAVIFDCFGVLVTEWLRELVDQHLDTNPDIDTIVWDIVRAANVGMIDHNQMVEQASKALNISPEEFVAYRINNESRNAQLFDFIVELRLKGIKTAILSNVSSGGVTRRFSKNDLALFDAVVESGVLGFTKPDKEIYLHTVKLLGVTPAECIMVDDREDFCGGAEDVGIKAILYQNYKQFRTDINRILS